MSQKLNWEHLPRRFTENFTLTLEKKDSHIPDIVALIFFLLHAEILFQRAWHIEGIWTAREGPCLITEGWKQQTFPCRSAWHKVKLQLLNRSDSKHDKNPDDFYSINHPNGLTFQKRRRRDWQWSVSQIKLIHSFRIDHQHLLVKATVHCVCVPSVLHPGGDTGTQLRDVKPVDRAVRVPRPLPSSQ